jgi:PAS domain S-box-containing protein
VVEDQTELICRFSPDGRLTFVNGAYCRYFGLDPGTCIGKHHTVLIPPEDFVLMKEAFSRISPTNPIVTIDNRIIMPDGSIRWQHWSDRAIYNDSGKVIEFQSVGMDITDRKQMEETFQEANKKLNLLTNITHHDIKNQMTALDGYLEILKTDMTLPDEAQKYLQKTSDIVDTIRHQIEFTNSYQDLKKQQPRWQNLGDSIRKAILDLDISHVQVSVSVPDVVMVYADLMFPKVFFNLIDNALHYGGQALTQVVLSKKVMGDFLVIICEDNGTGINNSEKEKIFERGYGKNTGLGLFLIREILGITGMVIQETGIPGKGSCFEIKVPKDSWKNG